MPVLHVTLPAQGERLALQPASSRQAQDSSDIGKEPQLRVLGGAGRGPNLSLALCGHSWDICTLGSLSLTPKAGDQDAAALFLTPPRPPCPQEVRVHAELGRVPAGSQTQGDRNLAQVTHYRPPLSCDRSGEHSERRCLLAERTRLNCVHNPRTNPPPSWPFPTHCGAGPSNKGPPPGRRPDPGLESEGHAHCRPGGPGRGGRRNRTEPAQQVLIAVCRVKEETDVYGLGTGARLLHRPPEGRPRLLFQLIGTCTHLQSDLWKVRPRRASPGTLLLPSADNSLVLWPGVSLPQFPQLEWEEGAGGEGQSATSQCGRAKERPGCSAPGSRARISSWARGTNPQAPRPAPAIPAVSLSLTLPLGVTHFLCTPSHPAPEHGHPRTGLRPAASGSRPGPGARRAGHTPSAGTACAPLCTSPRTWKAVAAVKCWRRKSDAGEEDVPSRGEFFYPGNLCGPLLLEPTGFPAVNPHSASGGVFFIIGKDIRLREVNTLVQGHTAVSAGSRVLTLAWLRSLTSCC
ncbi:PREDICTED: uncharacterized protein LOC102026368 [Chinchilla lanigera]|uniref:uncharacterized protein LOC102026368 n=1 Tax=Chinchilla lanigera TaxID=34839 RepID=UPI00038EFA04|nr:PREDICTED: uncharacterized protein LOC102026368 [Chinchilla lanigera]